MKDRIDEPGSRSISRLVGFDYAGEVVASEGRIFRGIYPGQGEVFREVLRICQQNDLFRLGIVTTTEATEHPLKEFQYDIVLEHEAVSLSSYPHEWSREMFKTAALLHIDLFLSLGRWNLTLKDWHPQNILFKGVSPIFIDFTSIIPLSDLQHEEYLKPTRRPSLIGPLWDLPATYYWEMYKRMYEPYFLLPLYLLSSSYESEAARRRIFETTLNASRQVVTKSEVFGVVKPSRLAFEMRELGKKMSLAKKEESKAGFFERIRDEIEGITFPSSSNYVDYYEKKNENFDFEPSASWTNKQRAVHRAIERLSPRTVLDIASNTGWFSIMAAKQGCEVVAFDLDDASIDRLYAQAREESLPVLPLVMDLRNLTPEVAPIEYEEEPSRSLIDGDFPLLMAAKDRLRCDMVLALGIVHHLALGEGWTFQEIIGKLAAFADRYLIVEFVDKDDRLIREEPEFFPAHNANPPRFDWYTMENLLHELRIHFRSVATEESFPVSRTLVVCQR